MLRKITLLMSLLGLALLSAGCIQIRLETELEKDGAGKGKLEIAISQGVTEAMARFADVEDMPDTDVSNLANLDAEELKTIAAMANVRIKKFKSEVKDGRRQVSLRMEFDSLRDYSWVIGNIFGEVGDGYGVFEGEDGTLIFKEAWYDFEDLKAALAPAPDPAELASPSDETMEKYRQLMGAIKAAAPEVEATQVVKVPGKIIRSNTSDMKGKTCTWTNDFGSIMADKDNLKPRVVFSAKGLKLEPLPAEEN